MDQAAIAQNTRCPRCGGDNECGYAGEGPCWCAVEFPLRMPLARPGACYCRRCLAIELAQRQQPAAPPPDKAFEPD